MTDRSQEPLTNRAAHGPGTTSLSLLARWQHNDPQAWERLTFLYYPLVYSWCRRAGLQPEDGRDVTQEVFQALAQSSGRFRSDDGKNSFRGWLWGVTRNQMNNFWRKASKQPKAAGGDHSREELLQLPDAELNSMVEQNRDDDEGLIIRRAMELIRVEFEETSWKAFWMVGVDGRSASDVAADLGISRNAVYLAKSRILKRLREEFVDLINF